MNKIPLNNLEFTKRLCIDSHSDFEIKFSAFQNISSNAYQGGGIYIGNSNSVIIISSFFKRCSSTNYGGAFFIVGKKCEVSQCCSTECFHTIAKDWNLGGGGYIKSSDEVIHETSTIIHCAPPDKLSYKAHGTFGIEGGIVTVKNINATRGSKYGYLIWNFLDVPSSKFINLDNMANALLYLNNGPTAKFSNCNMINQSDTFYSAYYCIYTRTNLNNIVFQANVIDLTTHDGSIIVKNSITDKSSLWSTASNCSVNIKDPKTFSLQHHQLCVYLERHHVSNKALCGCFIKHKAVYVMSFFLNYFRS